MRRSRGDEDVRFLEIRVPKGGWRDFGVRDESGQDGKKFVENLNVRSGRIVLIRADELIASGTGFSVLAEPILLTFDEGGNIGSRVLP